MRPRLLFALLAGCGTAQVDPDAPSPSAADGLTIAYQTRVDGEIEPCG